MNRNFLYRNRGNGVFEDVTAKAGVANTGRWAVAAGWFDYDNDGRLDLFVAHYVKWDPAKEPFCGDLKSYRTYCHPKYYEGLPNALYRNNGDGTFTDVSQRAGIAQHIGKGMGVAFADYDGDGRTDFSSPTTPFRTSCSTTRATARFAKPDCAPDGDERRWPRALVDGSGLSRPG